MPFEAFPVFVVLRFVYKFEQRFGTVFPEDADIQNEQNINEDIKAKELRVISEDGEQLGIISRAEALRIASEQDLDLVEVAPNAKPPVCRIMNFGKFKYEQQKKEHQAKRRNQGMELKELRLGRSIRIEKHDLDFKLKKAKEILGKGNRLQVFLQLKGREIAHSDLGVTTLQGFADALEEVGRLDTPPRKMGKRIMMTLAPVAPKKAKPEKKKPEKADSEAEPVEADAPAPQPEAEGDSVTETPSEE